MARHLWHFSICWWMFSDKLNSCIYIRFSNLVYRYTRRVWILLASFNFNKSSRNATINKTSQLLMAQSSLKLPYPVYIHVHVYAVWIYWTSAFEFTRECIIYTNVQTEIIWLHNMECYCFTVLCPLILVQII